MLDWSDPAGVAVFFLSVYYKPHPKYWTCCEIVECQFKFLLQKGKDVKQCDF